MSKSRVKPVDAGVDFSIAREGNRDPSGSIYSNRTEGVIDFSEIILTRLPDNFNTFFQNGGNAVNNLTGRLRDFLTDVVRAKQMAASERYPHLTRMENQIHDLFEAAKSAAPELSVALLLGDATMGALATERQHLKDAVAGINHEQARVGELAEEMQRIAEGARAASAEIGAAAQAGFFQSEALSHATAAVRWLWSSVAFGVCLALVGVLIAAGVWAPPTNAAPGIIANYVLGKVLVLGVLSFGLGFSARNYRSNQHNATLNRHRMNALQTFRALTEAAKGEDSRDVILKEAAAAIFGVQDTGYVKGGSGEPTQITQVLPSILRQGSQI